MALTLNNFWGAETGGLEESVSASASSSASSTEKRSGAYSYLPDNIITLDPFESVADAGGPYVFGGAVRITLAGTGQGDILRATATSSFTGC